MTTRFYAAWAIAAVLALLLPVAVPYAIWPPARFDKADSSGDCAGIAKAYAAEATNRAATLWPASVRVEQCAGTLSDPHMQFRTLVDARGPYGIRWASAEVTESNVGSFEENGGVALGLAALVAGVAAVSTPFVYLVLRQSLRMRFGPAS